MKRKEIILSIIGIFAVSVILVIIVKNNTKEYIMYDGALLALTIDGRKVASFPSDSNKYHTDIDCDGGIGEYLPDDNYEMKFTIKNITKDGVKCNIAFTTITDSNKNNYLLKTKVESVNTTNNNGYRYSGKQPDNWVWFNNELWRIIGSIPTTLSDKTVENRVKIIKSESIGELAYDIEDENLTFGTNSLYTILNEYYYGKTDATGLNICSGHLTVYSALCNYTNIGISSDINDYYGRMILNVYMNVGKSNSSQKTISGMYEYEVNTLTTNALKIGLMNASDYGYATSKIVYDTINTDSLGSYVSNNWMYGQGDEWTLTPLKSQVFMLSYDGDTSTSYTRYGLVVRPVVYLDSSVYIISGEGTESNPYILGM